MTTEAAGNRPPLALRRARLATATLFFANGCGLGSWLPHIPDVKLWHQLSDGVLGLALLAIAGGAVAALPVAGALTARYGSRPTSRLAALLFCGVLSLPLLAPDLPLLLAAFVLLGIGIGALDVSMNAHAVVVEERYGRPIMSSFHGMFSLGGLVGAALASGAMMAGLAPVAHLGLAAAVLAAAVLAAWRALLPTMPAAAGGPFFVLPRGRLAVLGAIALAAFMAEGAIGDWSALYLRMELGTSPATAAWGFAAFSLTMALGRLTGDLLVARLSAPTILVAGALLGSGALAVALLVATPAAAILGFAALGLGLANLAPIVFSAAGRLPGLAPGIGIAAVSTAGYGGFLAGPPLIGLVAEAGGLPRALGLVALAIALMIACAGALRPPEAPPAVALAG
jgi:fucose permease